MHAKERTQPLENKKTRPQQWDVQYIDEVNADDF